MEPLLLRYSTVCNQLRRRQRILRIADFKEIFDDIVSYLNNISFNKRKTDGMNILTTVCDELASLNTFRLFDHLVLRNHPIFDYIGRTFEMLLTKSNHLQKIPMIKSEEDCFSSTSYLITQLCLYQNDLVELFYGKISTEIFPVTEKPNPRDENIKKSDRQQSDEVTEKPNMKTACLPPNPRTARPIQNTKFDITKILGVRKFPHQLTKISKEIQIAPLVSQSNEIQLPARKFQDTFLTKIFFDQLICAIEDLSRNEYSSYHVKYKVIDQLVRLCSKLDVVNIILEPITKCLCSKYYDNAFQTIEWNQIQLNPKQLFFIDRCSQFLIQHDFLQEEKLADSLCKAIIDVTKFIFDKHFTAIDISVDSNGNGDKRIIMHALSCHIELLYHFSFTSTGRKSFLRSSIIDQLINLLEKNELAKDACETKYLFNADVKIVAYTVMLLYNLAYEKEVFQLLNQKDVENIFLNFKFAQDDTIQFAQDDAVQFAFTALSSIFKEETINENNKPDQLKNIYVQFLESTAAKSKQIRAAGVERNIKGKKNVKHVFVRGAFLDKLIRDIKHLATSSYAANEQRYKDAAQQIRVCSNEETNAVQPLLNPVITCLTSNDYLNVYKKIIVNEIKITKSYLPAKHLFFMRDCPAFIIQHDFKRQDEVAASLGIEILKKAEFIFQQNASYQNENQDNKKTRSIRNARIEAFLYYIKLLTHFSMAPCVRRGFLENTLIDEIIRILESETAYNLIDKTVNIKRLLVMQLIILLYNLAFNKQILSLLMNKNIINLCLRLRLIKNEMIQYISEALIIRLKPTRIDGIVNPQSLTKFCMEYLEISVKEPRRSYQGIKLNSMLRVLEIFLGNDLVQKAVIEEKEGLLNLVKCACVVSVDNANWNTIKKIRLFSLKIIWKLLSVAPALSKKLKSNDKFVDHLLTFVDVVSPKEKKIPSRIIWKLGDEETIRLEQVEKKKQLGKDDHRDDTDVTSDNQLSSIEPWDDSVPFDIIMSFSDDSSEKSLCRKIYNQLKKSEKKVYFEQQGKHRLESMKKAIMKNKLFLICLSTKYRTSKTCMAEIELAFRKGCPIIPIIVGKNFKLKGWLNHLIGKRETIDFKQNIFDDAFAQLITEINKTKPSD
ncbi:unnamed protein product [Rotaria magnacalcarata]|uniref:TIR domain-containing protein n=4 Tax=Rotaria magnacalcarata TaxID=392030 RepID=A0A816ZZP6_9BILA|nr:unnamed protein product [Rotaria magnacalcarata]CAF2244363.1 unnamed protein product [Rotaria magnacalcarata]CAF3991245.1 unnamed protein product [Rotaria magnacalcarata]CAF4045071.1 unnamed protein product [Rotaria magnacalcarata]